VCTAASSGEWFVASRVNLETSPRRVPSLVLTAFGRQARPER
jgi:hypothetical protein